MPEATIKNGVIECGNFKIEGNFLFQRLDGMWWSVLWDNDLENLHRFDDLYAVLHARHMAQGYDKTYLAKVAQAMKDEPLYKDEG